MGKKTAFGKCLKMLRIENDLTEKELAKKIGKSQGYISDVENGKIPPDYDFLIDCIRAFDLQKARKFEFLVKAMSNSKKITIPLSSVHSGIRNRFINLLAHVLLYETSLEKNDYTEPWIINVFLTLMGHTNDGKTIKTSERQ